MSWQKRTNPFGGHNYVLGGDGFFISFNPRTGSLIEAIKNSGNTPETALVPISENYFYILVGDFRAEYEALVPQGFAACKQFYDANKQQHGSEFSTEEEEES